jgi:transposase-like protein
MTARKKHKTRLLALEAVAGDCDLMMRCDVHFLRNALDYLLRKADDDCLQALRWIDGRRDIQEAQRELAAWISQWQGKYPKLVDGVETNIGKTTFYRPPGAHHKHMTSTNILERPNEEIKRPSGSCASSPMRMPDCG